MIGDGVFIGYNVVFVIINYDLFLKNKCKNYYVLIVLKNNVWIGLNVMIILGVMIGEWLVVVVGVVVIKDVLFYIVVGGVFVCVLKLIDKEENGRWLIK